MADEAGDISLGWETTKSLLAKFVQAALGFTGTIVFARVLGPTSFGGFYFLLTIVLFVDRPLRGVGAAVNKRFSETDAPRDQIMGGILAVNTAYFVAVGVVAWLLSDVLVAKTNVDSAAVVFVALLVGIGYFFPFQRMLGARGWIARQTWNDTLRSVLTLGLQLAFVGLGFGAAGMGYGLAVASVLSVVPAWYYLSSRPAVPNRDTWRSLWSFAKYSTPAAIVGKAYDRIDVLLVGAILTTTVVGYYEVAFKLTLPGSFVPGILASALLPKVSNLQSRGEAVTEDVSNAVAYVSILSVPIFFGALAISRPLVVTPYGAEYAPAAALLVGLALYQVVWSQTTVYQRVLSGLDLPDVGLRIDTATLAFNVVVGGALIFPLGAFGVVVATVLAESLRLGLSARALQRRVDGVSMLPRPLVAQVVAGAAMFVAVEVASVMVPLRTVEDVALLVLGGAAVYGGVLFVISPGLRVTMWSVYRDATEGGVV